MNSKQVLPQPARKRGLQTQIKKHRPASVLLFLCLLMGCSGVQEYEFKGATMGTFYSVKLVTSARVDRPATAAALHEQAEVVNRLMSNWIQTSDVSRFNAGPGPMAISEHTANVLKSALNTAQLTGGAFDPTLGPLIELWGFGAKGEKHFPPKEDIEAARARIGYHKLHLNGLTLSKDQAEVNLNLSANAKGYGVDLMADYLAKHGFTDFMVEVGGDVRVAGHNLKGQKWRMAIEDPGAPPWQSMYRIANLTDQAMATSGDYRNFFFHEGVRYSHIIDPRSGLPVPATIAAVSVVAPDCMTADAMATALMVLPPEEALALVEAQANMECLIILRDEQDGLKSLQTKGMAALLDPVPQTTPPPEPADASGPDQEPSAASDADQPPAAPSDETPKAPEEK